MLQGVDGPIYRTCHRGLGEMKKKCIYNYAFIDFLSSLCLLTHNPYPGRDD